MDIVKNPFAPGAGSPPPELAGRSAVLEQARILLHRIQAKKSEKSLMLTGLRGVGKTVLLNVIERMACDAGYKTALIEASEEKTLPETIAPKLRQLLFELNRIANAGDKVRRALSVLKSFIGSVKVTAGDVSIGLDIDPLQGTADSGDMENDLPDLFVAVAEAALERKTAVAIFIDEIQYFSSVELSALIMAMHRLQQKSLPLVLIGAGLPVLPGLTGESKSYAERLFSFPEIGALNETDIFKALQEPVDKVAVSFNKNALKFISRETCGYPYFIQEWGYQSWNTAERSPITITATRKASDIVKKRLDENFFKVRFNRLTEKEKVFLRAMAALGSGPYRQADIEHRLGRKTGSLSPARASLMKKGMVYSPSYGYMAFTVPLFGSFMLRAIPEFSS